MSESEYPHFPAEGGSSTDMSEKVSDAEPQWEPLREARRTSRASREASLRSLSRARSQNGYGCDSDVEAPPPVEDPFIVGWEGGDADPLNPRSRSVGLRWLSVVVMSLSSVCV